MIKKSSFNSFLENELNSAQKEAATHANGSILVIAGAGSGKTRVITARITSLIIHKNILPSTIVALTFTNKAANEMKKRIKQFLGNNNDLPFIGTFHSYCLQILKKNHDLLPTPFFSILDNNDQQKLIKAILKRNNLHKQFTPKVVLYQISHIKNHAIKQDNLEKTPLHPLLHEVYKMYEQEKRASKSLDFDDLLLETLQLFKKNRSFKKLQQEQINHILVDEYQDTNIVQHALLKQMATKNRQLSVQSICAVGDEDQSIYSWRGATIANMLNFKKDFPETKTIKIEQNYRSVQPILDIANNVIQNNRQRNPKKLWSNKRGSNRIYVFSCLSEYQEAEIIAQMLSTIQTKHKLSTMAILYRTHTQSRAIEEALIKQSIPYKIIGGIQFYERKEIKDLLAYLRLVVNPFDRTSFFRIINTPLRGLGEKCEEQLYETWHKEPFLTFHQLVETCIKNNIVSKTKAKALQEFVSIFDGLEPKHKSSAIVEHIIQKTAYVEHIKKNYDPLEAQARIDNIKEFIAAANHFESQNTQNNLTLFLDDIALMQEKMNPKQDKLDTVTLMTLHAAKGLEFDTIILSGLEEGLLPSAQSLKQDNSLEEERRLFYVGITRAKERLLLLHAKYRYSYGKMVEQNPSRFLDEIPSSLPHEDSSYWKQNQVYTFFSDWFGIKKNEASKTFQGTRSIKKQKNILEKGISHRSFFGWKKNQPVKHKKYGTGIIKLIEKRGKNRAYVTVLFKSGIKKILSDFLYTL